jgi:magnesium-protoporphyrin O-methyltransferase
LVWILPAANPEVPVSCAQCKGIVQEFNDRVAGRELRRYRRRGPSGSTRRLLDALAAQGVSGRSFLDVGGGVGAIQHDLITRGASHGTHVDASPAYLAAARSEAERLGHADRVRFIEGDFVALAPDVDAVDVVTLDRVLCCYDDMPALVDASASRARALYGLVFPREHLLMRSGVALLNVFQRIRRRPFNVFLHGTASVEARVLSNGFRKILHATTPLWQIHLYRRDEASAPAPS